MTDLQVTLPNSKPQGYFISRSIVNSLLNKLKMGQITVSEHAHQQVFGDVNASTTDKVDIQIHDADFYRQLAYSGSLGAAASYIEGQWSSSDLVKLLRFMLQNRQQLDDMEQGVARITGLLNKLVHFFNRNTQAGSKKNIHAHYDLGNDLFETFLDSRMMYSSGLYLHDSDDLDQAQENKLAQICQQLQLKSSDHLLEIGTGWGGLAIYAAQNYGCQVTTTTISEEQYQAATQRINSAGLAAKITLLKQDYRTLNGRYDKIVSIEMVEAVGDQFLDQYFNQCSTLLKSGGKFLLQAIVLEDHRYLQSLKSVDFIKHYIFPGSFIPCISRLCSSASSAKLQLQQLNCFGSSYATTLNHWRQRFLNQKTEILRQGYDQEFIRLWEFYLAYCEAGFEENATDVTHMLLCKQGPGHASAIEN